MQELASRDTAKARENYHHGDLRRALLEAAYAEIAQNGFAAMTLASLARRAGVSQPAPYKHFADREGLLEAVAAEGFEAFAAELRQAVEGLLPSAGLKNMARAYVVFGERNTELYRLMFASRLVASSRPGSDLKHAARRSFDVLTEAVAAALPHAPPFPVARLIWAHVHGLVMLKADGFIEEDLAGLVEIDGVADTRSPSSRPATAPGRL